MELRTIYLSRETYGADKGKLKGNVTVSTLAGEIKLYLSEEKAGRILNICADQLVENAKEVAQNITKEILEHNPNAALGHEAVNDG